ncbi:uncharacterized protein [Palaemon carinicauda]|uniref:uncharacterized protein n=1 Tax=Palaemon carinicauda TaxID=392227 RepID=UPI0035B65FC3
MLGITDVLQDCSVLPTSREQTATTTCSHVSHVEPTNLQPNHTPPPTNCTSRPNLNPSRHAIPELPSPPSPLPKPKPQRPPRHPPKSKRFPSHTPSTPSPLRFTSPSIPSTFSQQTRPQPSSSYSVPETHTPITSNSS